MNTLIRSLAARERERRNLLEHTIGWTNADGTIRLIIDHVVINNPKFLPAYL